LYILTFEEILAEEEATQTVDKVKWEQLADTTDRLLRLNPYDFIGAFYYNGVAQYQLRHFDEAEKTLRETMGMDFRNQIPKAHYVLGLILIAKRNYAEAKESFQEFAKLAPKDPIIPKVNDILLQMARNPNAMAVPQVGAAEAR
jgi:tetratricopeptide (TPR) repeat protein